MINKLLLCFIVATSYFSTTSALDNKDIQGRRKLDRKTATLTAKLLISKLQQATAQYTVDPINLYNEIKKAPAKHIYVAKSRKLLAKEYSQMLKDTYKQQASQILTDIEARLGSTALFDKTFRTKSCKLDYKNIKKNLQLIFPATYNRARAKIYLEQRQKIIGKIYPTATEFDTIARKALLAQLEKRVIQAQNFAVFEENFTFIRQSIIAPVIKNAEQQRKLQLRATQLTNFSQQFLPSEFELVIKKNVDNTIALLRKSKRQHKVYTLFPSVKQAIPKVAKQAALNKFARYLLEVKPHITEAELVKPILNSPAQYRTAQQSQVLVFKLMESRLFPKVIDQYSKQAPTKQQLELKNFLNKNRASSAVCKNALLELFKQNYATMLKQARNKVTKIQLKKSFPKLADLSWTPPAKLVQEYYKTNKKTYLANPYAMPGISETKIEKAQLLTETVNLAKHNIDYIFANARRALAGQNKIVDNTYATVAASIPTASEPGTFTRILNSLGLGSKEKTVIDEQKIYKAFLKQVTTQWEAERIKTVWLSKAPQPVNIKTKYLELFPEVKNYIKILTKAIIMDHTERKKIKPQPEKKPQPEAVRKLSLTFDVDLIDSQIVVLMSSPATKTNKQFSAPNKFSDYQSNEQQFNQSIAQAFTKQVKQLAASGALNLAVTIRVHNGKIFYKIISNLRNSINQAAEKMQSAGLELIITDRLY